MNGHSPLTLYFWEYRMNITTFKTKSCFYFNVGLETTVVSLASPRSRPMMSLRYDWCCWLAITANRIHIRGPAIIPVDLHSSGRSASLKRGVLSWRTNQRLQVRMHNCCKLGRRHCLRRKGMSIACMFEGRQKWLGEWRVTCELAWGVWRAISQPISIASRHVFPSSLVSIPLHNPEHPGTTRLCSHGPSLEALTLHLPFNRRTRSSPVAEITRSKLDN